MCFVDKRVPQIRGIRQFGALAGIAKLYRLWRPFTPPLTDQFLDDFVPFYRKRQFFTGIMADNIRSQARLIITGVE